MAHKKAGGSTRNGRDSDGKVEFTTKGKEKRKFVNIVA